MLNSMGVSRLSTSVRIMIDQKQLENVEYFNDMGILITIDARRTREIKSIIAVAQAAFNSTKTILKVDVWA
jgi:hypothetical protein